MDKHKLFHPPIDVKNLKNKDEVLLIMEVKNGEFEVAFLDAHFGPLPKSVDNVPVKDFSKFLDAPDCQNLKAVIFLLVDCDNVVNLEIRQIVYEEVIKRKWPINLVHPKTLTIMCMLFFSKIETKPGDVVLHVLSMDEMVTVSVLQRKQQGYSYMDRRMINCFNRNVNDVAIECLGTCNPQYITVCDLQDNDLLMSFKSVIFPSKKVIKIDSEGSAACTLQVLKTIFEHGYNQLIPFALDILAVTNETNFADPEHAVITVDEYEELPLEKVQVVPKSKKPFYVSNFDKTSESYKHAGKVQLSKEQEGHRLKLALVVDRNSLPFLYQEPFIIPEIEAFPKKLTSSKVDLNVPVIGFFDNSSVICVRDENGYKFLFEWNGLYGKDLYLCFEEEKPTIVTDVNKVRNKDPFVVYDLIKILSVPPKDLKADPKWGFKVTSNSENPVLLEYDTFLGIRKVATPVFIMALLLKHHIKAIKKETGKKPNGLGFCLFSKFTKKEKKRIKNGLEEACKLLKICFVVTNV